MNQIVDEGLRSRLIEDSAAIVMQPSVVTISFSMAVFGDPVVCSRLFPNPGNLWSGIFLRIFAEDSTLKSDFVSTLPLLRRVNQR